MTGFKFCEGGFCPPSSWEGAGNTKFMRCHPGYTANKTGGVDRTVCEPTIPGYSKASASSGIGGFPFNVYAANDICADGSYCPLGSASRSNAYDLTQKCHPGTRGSGTGKQSVDECTACPGGNYCAEGIASGATSD